MVAPSTLAHILITEAHGIDHVSRGEIKRRIQQQDFGLQN